MGVVIMQHNTFLAQEWVSSYAGETYKREQSPVTLYSVFEKKTRVGKSRLLLRQNVLRPYWNAKPAFSKSSALKSVFEKLRLTWRLVPWTGAVTVEIKVFNFFRRSIDGSWYGILTSPKASVYLERTMGIH